MSTHGYDREGFLTEFFPDAADRAEVETGAQALVNVSRAHRLAEMRKRLGLTQAEVALRLGVTQQTFFYMLMVALHLLLGFVLIVPFLIFGFAHLATSWKRPTSSGRKGFPT